MADKKTVRKADKKVEQAPVLTPADEKALDKAWASVGKPKPAPKTVRRKK